MSKTADTLETAMAIRIHRAATSSREYDCITVVISDLHLSCDLVSERQIRLADGLARSHGLELRVDPELRERVEVALTKNHGATTRPVAHEAAPSALSAVPAGFSLKKGDTLSGEGYVEVWNENQKNGQMVYENECHVIYQLLSAMLATPRLELEPLGDGSAVSFEKVLDAISSAPAVALNGGNDARH